MADTSLEHQKDLLAYGRAMSRPELTQTPTMRNAKPLGKLPKTDSSAPTGNVSHARPGVAHACHPSPQETEVGG